ncbi:helix-turn-helix transcriptional regulator [Actinomadura sp. HBU206391]|uniref:helix-turn-helix transcriptional regulator n=1 Tax=Actinomadura sp. HBU206391 TaxID=2731692 RepID=UPI00164F64DF|nr:AAA family ATPase [Actinomadura sp. HBU206391]MBC6461796.1 AAA family ATPase [Actinomadura sp. HBU206391]
MPEHYASGGLIGRATELGLLVRALDKAASGQAGVVLVSGDAGVGKTRLVGELAEVARSRGHTVLIGQCAELGESMPYLPLADALWGASRAPETASFLLEALRARPVLSRLLPDGDADRADPGGSEVAQQQLFGAALGLLGELSDNEPVLLVFEDLHWADRSTRDLLTFLSRVLQRERVCLVGTYRTDDLPRRHPMRSAIAELLRLPNVVGADLGPLRATEMAAYLTSLESDGGGRPTAEVFDRVIQRAEGNAFYAEELLAAACTGDELPTGLADLLLSRVERLPETAQRVVRIAAVGGRRVDDDLVREVSGLEEEPYEQALREVVSHQLLVPDGGGYVFRHALLREAVYGDLLPGERTRLHAAFAGLLTGPRPVRRARPAAELAYHNLASHDMDGAFTASVEAGREAERLAAPAEAHQHFDQALSLWDVVTEPERRAGMDRPHLALRTAAAASYSGDTRRAVTQLRRLRESLDPATDLTLYAEVSERFAYYLSDCNEDEQAAETAREIIEMLPADTPSPARARALTTYTRTVLLTARHEEIPALAEEAITIARATGTADAEAGALVSIGLHTEIGGDLARAERLFTVARSAAGRAGDLNVALRAYYHCARAEYDRAELAAAARTTDSGVRLAVDSGLAWSVYGIDLRFLQYLVHYTAGDWDRAEALSDSFPLRVGTPAEAQVSAYALFIEVARGSATARERLSWLRPFWGEDDLVAYIARGLAAELALAEGDEQTALDHINAVLKRMVPNDAGIIRLAATGLRVHAERALRARSAGDGATEAAALRAAGDLAERARWAAANIASGPRLWLGCEGRAWLARVEAEWHRARGDDDPKLWAGVVEAFDYGFPYEVARSRLRLAGALLEHGRRDEAEGEWRQATAEADRLAALPLRKALRDLGHRARFGTAERAEAAGPLAALTSREREVLRLVAEGDNNRDIAAALFISPKTASVHVSNILAKLDVTSRTQAAAIAHREGLG